MNTVEIRDQRFLQLVDEHATMERVASGFTFVEGPLWHSTGRFLLFSDMPGDRIRRWSAEDGVTTFRAPSNMANGNTYDREGRLITCEHATSRVSRTEPDGTVVTLASHYEGRQLNSPNDVVAHSDGSIWFTDPIFGRVEFFGVPREPELPFRGVYRLGADGALTLLVDDFAQPNGLCFTRNEQQLLVNDTERGHIRAFPVLPGGQLGSGRLWATVEGTGAGAPDGLKADSQGNVWCCGPGGIHAFDPDGVALGVVRTPEVAANFAWGDEDLRTLYVCASTSLYRVRVQVPGSST
jgi:gluconolactonase